MNGKHKPGWQSADVRLLNNLRTLLMYVWLPNTGRPLGPGGRFSAFRWLQRSLTSEGADQHETTTVVTISAIVSLSSICGDDGPEWKLSPWKFGERSRFHRGIKRGKFPFWISLHSGGGIVNLWHWYSCPKEYLGSQDSDAWPNDMYYQPCNRVQTVSIVVWPIATP